MSDDIAIDIFENKMIIRDVSDIAKKRMSNSNGKICKPVLFIRRKDNS